MNIIEIIDKSKYVLGLFYSPTKLVLQVVAILIISSIVSRLGNKILLKVFDKQKKLVNIQHSKKYDTLSVVTRSIYRYIIYFTSFICILTYLSDALKLQTVLAAAGIGGIALGLSAQNLIKDILAGILIVLDDQFSIGDEVRIDTYTGVVEEIQLRVTKIRGDNGDLHIIANGEIRKVSNQTRGARLVEIEIPISSDTKVEKVTEILSLICENVGEEFDFFVEKPRVVGITSFGRDGYNMKIVARTPALKQYDVERRIRLLVNKEFINNQIYNRDLSRILLEQK